MPRPRYNFFLNLHAEYTARDIMYPLFCLSNEKLVLLLIHNIIFYKVTV